MPINKNVFLASSAISKYRKKCRGVLRNVPVIWMGRRGCS